jgi:transposase
MDTSAVVRQESVAHDTLGRRIVRRRFRTLAEKRQIVAESREPGASVAEVARRYGINSNMLFAWRRLEEAGLLSAQRQRRDRQHAAPMLPVRIDSPAATADASRAAERYIEILLGDGTCVRSVGALDRAALAEVLSLLRA